MSTYLLDISIATQGLGQAVGALRGLSATAAQTYSQLELLKLSYSALASQELLASKRVEDMTTARARGAEYAEELFNWSVKLAQVSPFGTQDIAGAVKLAQAYGFVSTSVQSVTEAQEQNLITAQRVVSAFANITAGTGGSPFAIGELTQVLGQIQGIGKLQAEEWYQFSERSIPIGQILAESLNKPIDAIIRLREEGKLTSEIVIPSILQWAEKYYGTAMQDAGNTWQGLTSGLADAFNFGLSELAEPSIERLKPEIESLIDYLNSDEVKNYQSVIGEAIATDIDLAIDALKELRVIVADPEFQAALGGIGTGIQGGISDGLGFVNDFARHIPLLKSLDKEIPQSLGSATDILLTPLRLRNTLNPNLSADVRSAQFGGVIQGVLSARETAKGLTWLTGLLGDDYVLNFSPVPDTPQRSSFSDDTVQPPQSTRVTVDFDNARLDRLFPISWGPSQDTVTPSITPSSGGKPTFNLADLLADPTEMTAEDYEDLQSKITDLAADQAQKLIDLREQTNQKARDKQEAYQEAEAEAHYQHNRSLAESDYQHQRSKDEATYQFRRQQSEAQRQWDYQQQEAARKHAMAMAEAERDRLFELQSIADDLMPTTQTALDTLATTEADFQQDATERLEAFNAKRQLLAEQGAMCKLPEEAKAFAEQEQQAAEAYQKQEQQQREALGRQLIDYTVAMALRNDVSAQAMQSMVTGIAQATGAYDSVTAGLLGNTFAGINLWASSGGQGAESVLNTIRQLPDAARDAKQAEQQLSATLREQAVETYQRTGNVEAYQRALNAIPGQVATRLGVSTDQALPMSDVYQGQEQWLEQQSEVERDYAMQVEEDRRNHQHTLAEDQRTHNLDIEEMDRQHRRTKDEEERQYQKDREEAWRLHLKEIEKLRTTDHQQQLEEQMRQGDRLVAEALAQAGNLSAAQTAALTGDYEGALDYELKIQNWLTEKLDRVNYSDPEIAQKARENIYRSYAGLRGQYKPENFMPDWRMPHGGSGAPSQFQGVPLTLTVNLQADGMVVDTVNKVLEIVDGQLVESETTGAGGHDR